MLDLLAWTRWRAKTPSRSVLSVLFWHPLISSRSTSASGLHVLGAFSWFYLAPVCRVCLSSLCVPPSHPLVTDLCLTRGCWLACNSSWKMHMGEAGDSSFHFTPSSKATNNFVVERILPALCGRSKPNQPREPDEPANLDTSLDAL